MVGVWVGRPDGTAVPGATGLTQALPLMAQVFGLLPPGSRPIVTEPAGTTAPRPAPDGLRLLSPPPGAVLAANAHVTLRAMGGRRPLTFLVNGTLVPNAVALRQTGWMPGGAGFYAVTVLDADGLSARADVQVR